jgi:hypothetical protein
VPSGSFDVGLNRLEITALVKRLAVAEPAMRKKLPGALRKAVRPMVEAAQANADAVSPNTKIRIGVRTRLVGRNGASIKITATSPSKPALGPLLERGNKGNSPTIRHPVFGQDVWVSQPTQPYLQPAVDAHQKEAIVGTSAVMTEVLAAMKFR